MAELQGIWNILRCKIQDLDLEVIGFCHCIEKKIKIKMIFNQCSRCQSILKCYPVQVLCKILVMYLDLGNINDMKRNTEKWPPFLSQKLLVLYDPNLEIMAPLILLLIRWDIIYSKGWRIMQDRHFNFRREFLNLYNLKCIKDLLSHYLML